MDARNCKERDVFEETYRGCTGESRVRPGRLSFCVNWAKDYANFLPDKPFGSGLHEGFLLPQSPEQ